MACPTILTGDRFLLRLIDHIDCQAQTLGSFGFQSLAATGSPTSAALTGLLTLFIALFAVRLLFGPTPAARDIVGDVLRVGIVLTLALSWPAYRVLVYDVVIHSPAEVAASISGPELAPGGAGLAERLQNVDTGILALTTFGAGRTTGGLLEGDARSGGFRAIALNDDSALGYARMAFLAGTIAPIVVLRLGAGLLLALAPLAAGLLLFEASRGIFAGWLRGLVLTTLGAMALTVALSVELAVLEPWLSDALRLRSLGYATPSAPTELLAMAVGFPLGTFGLLALMARVAFHRGWSSIPRMETVVASGSHAGGLARSVRPGSDADATVPSRAFLVAESVRSAMRHEEVRGTGRTVAPLQISYAVDASRQLGRSPTSSSGRRTSRRASVAGKRRDAAT